MRRDHERSGSLYRTPDSEQHRRQPYSGTSAHGLFQLGWTDIILDTRIVIRLHGSRQHDAARTGEGDWSQWGDLDLDDLLGPVNNWLYSLFSQIDVYLNGTPVTPSTNTYAFRAYIEKLLSYGTDAKVTQLTSQLWHKDTATRMNAVVIDDGAVANARFVARRANIVRSRVDDMFGCLHVDLFLQDKFSMSIYDRCAMKPCLRSLPANPIAETTSSMPPCLQRRQR